MFKHYFEQIHNIEIWPVISLVLFFVFFTFTLIWIFTLDKKHVEKMKSLPFDDDGDENKTDIKI